MKRSSGEIISNIVNVPEGWMDRQGGKGWLLGVDGRGGNLFAHKVDDEATGRLIEGRGERRPHPNVGSTGVGMFEVLVKPPIYRKVSWMHAKD